MTYRQQRIADAIRDYANINELKAGTAFIHNQADAIAAHVAKVARDKYEPVLPPETYTASGLPRRAASRAREHGAKIRLSAGAALFLVAFPNGSAVEAWTLLGAKAAGRENGQVHASRNGAAPDAKAPAGRTLEDVLNAFADAEEGRR